MQQGPDHLLTQFSLTRLVLPIVTGLVFYIAIASLADIDQVTNAVRSMPGSIWPVIFGMSAINLTTRFTRWHLYLIRLGHPLPITQNALIYLSGFALTMTPGKAGETIRSLLLSPYQVKYSQSLACFFCERLLDVIVVSFIALQIIAIFPQYQTWAISIFILLLTGACLVRSHSLPTILGYLPVNNITLSSHSFHRSVRLLYSGRLLVISIVLGLAAWAAQSYSLALIVQVLGFNTSTGIVMGIYCLSILAGAASFIPGGIGATEAAMALLLSNIGMEPALAVAAALVLRLFTLWLAVGLGCIALICINIKAKQATRGASA